MGNSLLCRDEPRCDTIRRIQNYFLNPLFTLKFLKGLVLEVDRDSVTCVLYTCGYMPVEAAVYTQGLAFTSLSSWFFPCNQAYLQANLLGRYICTSLLLCPVHMRQRHMQRPEKNRNELRLCHLTATGRVIYRFLIYPFMLGQDRPTNSRNWYAMAVLNSHSLRASGAVILPELTFP